MTENKPPQRTYFTNIQALRAVAALLVVIYHLNAIESKYFPTHWVPAVLGVSGTAGVDLFFVISGFVMVAVSKGSFRQPGAGLSFLLRRVLRIYPVYWFYALIVLAVWFAVPEWVNASAGHHVNVLASLLLAPSDTIPLLIQAWTLTYEMFFYIVFAGFIRWLPERALLPALALWAGATLASHYLVVASGSAAVRVATNPLVLEFIGGCIIALVSHRLSRRMAPRLLLLGITLFAASFAYATNVPFDLDHSRAVIFGIPAFVLVLGAVSTEQTIGLSAPQWLSRFGNASYSLYLSHILAMSAVGRLWHRFAPAGVSSMWGSLACLGMAVVTGVLAYCIVERRVIALAYRLVPDSLIGHSHRTAAAVAPKGAFGQWVLEVEAEARRVLERPTGDITWLIGRQEDMQASFNDGDNPAEYVQAQMGSIN